MLLGNFYSPDFFCGIVIDFLLLLVAINFFPGNNLFHAEESSGVSGSKGDTSLLATSTVYGVAGGVWCGEGVFEDGRDGVPGILLCNQAVARGLEP